LWGNIKFICTALETGRKTSLWLSFPVLFLSEGKSIIYFPTMLVYCVYLALSTSPKQLSSCLKRAETSVVAIVLMVSSVKSAIIHVLLPFLTVALSLQINQVPEKLRVYLCLRPYKAKHYPVNAIWLLK